MTESEIRYLIDEDTTHRIRKGLQRRQPSIDIKVIGEEGAPPLGTKDPDILDYLEQAGCILISTNRSTMPKHLQEHLHKGGHVPGILILRAGFSLGQIIETLELIWFAGAPEEFRDRIIYIPF